MKIRNEREGNMTTTKKRRWKVTVVLEERDDLQPLSGSEEIAGFVTWKLEEGVYIDVVSVAAEEEK
jgi:hypothetical protein